MNFTSYSSENCQYPSKSVHFVAFFSHILAIFCLLFIWPVALYCCVQEEADFEAEHAEANEPETIARFVVKERGFTTFKRF